MLKEEALFIDIYSAYVEVWAVSGGESGFGVPRSNSDQCRSVHFPRNTLGKGRNSFLLP